MFESTDSYLNMAEIFSNFKTQVEELMKTKTIRINGVLYPLRVFYFGDTEFLCKVFGHMGPASSYPCLWCHVQLKQLRNPDGKPHCPMRQDENGKWVPNEAWPQKRSCKSMQQDLANLLSEEEDERGNGRVSGRDYHSISKPPIFPLPEDIEHIIPPALHIILGLVVRYFKLLEEKCRKLDQSGVHCEDEDLYNTWQLCSEKAKDAEVSLEESKEVLKEEEEVLSSLKAACSSKGKRNIGLDQPCSMPLCKLHVSKPKSVDPSDVPWIKCSDCSKWYHGFCVGMNQEEVESEENDEFVCHICRGEISGPDDVVKIQNERVCKQREVVAECTENYDDKKKVLDGVYERVVSSRGSIEKDLNDKLENELHVKRQAYHSQCFVGNHCMKILENTDVLIDVLPDTEEGKALKRKMYGLFGRLRGIFRYFKAKFLTTDEIKALCVRCWELGTWFPKNFPSETIPPKLHFLICHIPDCAIKFRTIGLLSEHGLESIHKDVNAIERVYCTVRDKEERMRLVVANHQQRVATSSEATQVPIHAKKTCYMDGCKGRYKLTSDRKSRQCQKCGHILKVEQR